MAEEEKKRVKKPKSKARKIIEWVLTGLFLLIFGFILVGTVDGMIHKKDHYEQSIRLGFATFVVETESMEPKYNKKSAIITYLDSPEKLYQKYLNKEVIDVTFFDAYTSENEYTTPSPDKHPELIERTSAMGVPMTHRIQEIKKGNDGHYYFITAGINNSVAAATDSQGRIKQYQVFTEKELLGRVVIGSAFLGGFFSFVGSPLGLLVLLLIPAFYLVITSVIDIFRAYKEPEEANAAAEGEIAKADNDKKTGEIELSAEDKERLKNELLEEMLNKKKGE